MTGPPPKPTAIKVFEGNPGKRPLNQYEPKLPPVSTMNAPSHLDSEAKKEWRRLVKLLARAKVLTALDRGVLAAYCSAWSSYVAADKQVQKYGDVLMSPKTGIPYPSPYINLRAMAMKQMGKHGPELGLTPSARSRIQTAEAKTDDLLTFVASR